MNKYAYIAKHGSEEQIMLSFLELTTEIANLRAIISLANINCDNVHHAKKHQHTSIEVCPVVNAIKLKYPEFFE